MYEYPFGNGQQLNLDWFLSEWKNLLAAWEAEKNGIEGALQAEIDRAEAALADVFAARDAAAQSAANALESKNAAAQSASDASGYLATVHADANTASDAARNAAQSESNATESAQTALASKNAAAQSETAAGNNASAAAQSAADALAHKDAAAQSAANALESKNAAAQSAEDASDAAASVEASAQQISTNTADIINLKESAVNKAPIIVNTASGTIAHFKDGAENMPVKALSIDGADSANIIRTGKNLIDPSLYKFSSTALKGLSLTVQSDGTIIANGTATGSGSTTLIDAGRIVLPNGTYSFIYEEDQKVGVVFRKEDKTTHSTGALSNPFTVDDAFGEQYYLYANIFVSEAGTYNVIIQPQIELGSTPSAYEPYQSETFEYPTEPVTTLYGVNNIWSDEGEINVTYRADTKLYIDNKIANLQATMLENIGG